MQNLKDIVNNFFQIILNDFELNEIDFLGNLIFEIKSESASYLIGKNGYILEKINYILHKIAEGKDINKKFIVDINEYKLKRFKNLQKQAKMLANRAKSFQYNVEMPNLTAYERLIVHNVLADEEDIKTESRGEGKNRKLYIIYTGN